MVVDSPQGSKLAKNFLTNDKIATIASSPRAESRIVSEDVWAMFTSPKKQRTAPHLPLDSSLRDVRDMSTRFS